VNVNVYSSLSENGDYNTRRKGDKRGQMKKISDDGVEIEGLYESIFKIKDQLGWSRDKLARELYFELYELYEDECEDEGELKKFCEKLKKGFQRKNIKKERLEEYLKVISRHPELEKLNIIIPRYHTRDILGSNMLKQIKETSKEVSLIIKK